MQRLEELLALQPVHVLLQDGDVAFEHPSLDGVAHDVAQLRDLDRLGEVVVRAVLQRVDRGFGRRVARDHDEDRVGSELLSLLEQLDAAELAHADVGDDDIEVAPPQQLQRIVRGGGGHEVQAVVAQGGAVGLGDARLVVDEQDRRHAAQDSRAAAAAGWAGIATVTVVPRPISLAKLIFPLWSSTI